MPKRILQGTVVSDKNDKTVVVRVERRFAHPLLQKTVRRSKKYKAHDERKAQRLGKTPEGGVTGTHQFDFSLRLIRR